MQYNKLVNTLLDAFTKEYPKRRFLLTKLLGSGAEGGAFLASASDWSNNPQQVVIKIQKNMKPNEKQFLSSLIEYQNLYENGNNQQYLPTYLIRIYEYFQWQKNHCIVMEVGQEDLYRFINNSRNVSIQEKVQICFQIIYPILFLHQQKLIHRDIKPENYIKVGNVFKLIDFGLIRSSLSDVKTLQVGSTIFQAPEILENRSDYTDKVDIWSLGCVFYEILQTQPLFDGQTHQEVTKNIKNHKTYPVPVNNKINQLQISQQFKTILTSMLIYDEKKRPSIQQVYDEFKSYLNPQPKVIPQIIPKPDIPQPLQQQENNQQQQIKTQNTNSANKSENNSSEQQNQIIQNKELNQNQQQPKVDQIKLEEFNQYQLIQIQKIVDSMVESKLKDTQNQLIQREQQINQLNQKISDITDVMNKKQQEEYENQNKRNQYNQDKLKEIESQVQSIQQQKSNNEIYNQDEKFQQSQSEIMIVQQQLKQIQEQQHQLQNIVQQSQQKTQQIIQENYKLFKEQEVKLQEFLDKNIQEQNQQLTIKFNEIQIELRSQKDKQFEINNQYANIEQDYSKKKQEIQNITVQCEEIIKTKNEIKIQQEKLQNSLEKLTQSNLSNQNRIDEQGKQIIDIQNKLYIVTNKSEDFDQEKQQQVNNQGQNQTILNKNNNQGQQQSHINNQIYNQTNQNKIINQEEANNLIQNNDTQNIQNEVNKQNDSLRLLLDQKDNQIKQYMQEKQLAMQLFKQYTIILVQDLKDKLINQVMINEQNINNQLSSQQQNQDQELPKFQKQQSDQLSNNQVCNNQINEIQINESSVDNPCLNILSTQDQKNLFENLRTELQKQINDVLFVQENRNKDQLNLIKEQHSSQIINLNNEIEDQNNQLKNITQVSSIEKEQLNIEIVDLKKQIENITQVFQKEKEEQIHLNREIENSNQDLKKQLEQLNESLDQQKQQIQELQQNSQKELNDLKQDLEMCQKASQAEKLRQSKEINELNEKIKKHEEDNKIQNEKIKKYEEEIKILNEKIKELEEQSLNKNQELQKLNQENQQFKDNLNQAIQSQNQMNALIEFFKQKQNLDGFIENNSEKYMELGSLLSQNN